jgi:hypothetical protein
MSVGWSRHEPQDDVPVVDGTLWRGVRFALLIEFAVGTLIVLILR